VGAASSSHPATPALVGGPQGHLCHRLCSCKNLPHHHLSCMQAAQRPQQWVLGVLVSHKGGKVVASGQGVQLQEDQVQWKH
jgi:hypothetical protein